MNFGIQENKFCSSLEKWLLENKSWYKYDENGANKKLEKNRQIILNAVKRLKLNTTKKYMISGYYEWKILRRILKFFNDISFHLVKDKSLTRKVVKGGFFAPRDETIKRQEVLYISITKIKPKNNFRLFLLEYKKNKEIENNTSVLNFFNYKNLFDFNLLKEISNFL